MGDMQRRKYCPISVAEGEAGEVAKFHYVDYARVADEATMTRSLGGGRANQLWVPSNAVQAAGVQPATPALNGQGFFVYSFADNQDRNVQFNMQIPPEMDRSLPLRLCFGWSSPAVAQTLIMDYSYLITGEGDDTEGAPTTVTGVAFTSAAIADGLVISQFAELPGGTIGADAQCLHFSLERDGNNVLDTLGDIMELHGVALRYTTQPLEV